MAFTFPEGADIHDPLSSHQTLRRTREQRAYLDKLVAPNLIERVLDTRGIVEQGEHEESGVDAGQAARRRPACRILACAAVRENLHGRQLDGAG